MMNNYSSQIIQMQARGPSGTVQIIQEILRHVEWRHWKLNIVIQFSSQVVWPPETFQMQTQDLSREKFEIRLTQKQKYSRIG
jgi:hypothetical protein